MNERILWIWLSLACTPGSQTFAKLIEKHKTPSAIYALSKDEITDTIGSRSSDLIALSDKNLDKATEIYDFCSSKGVGILAYGDEAFPNNLRNIKNPPVLLYFRGKLPDFSKSFCVSMVGTRSLSQYGLKYAFVLSRDLSRCGATIVSGMAIGVDGVSHAGALSVDGVTVAFLGSGIDVCYPSDHKTLARAIVKSGCVFTEYPPGTRPEKYNFPVRNRLISGISELTLVVEGKERSGALLTARHAEEQGRPVYALPGNVNNPNSALTNLLIRNGAKICLTADDIIRDYDMKARGLLNLFLLPKRDNFDVYEELKKYSVVAVTSNDRVFRRSRRTEAERAPSVTTEESQPACEAVPSEKDLSGFDADAVTIFKRIPSGAECDIESLVDEKFPLRRVMKALLKLEMGRFIVMLPGEKVKRNF